MVKVYRDGSLENIKKEMANAKQAFLHGIPTAISYDIVSVGNLYGSVFELIRSDTLAKVLTKHPEQTDLYAQKIYELLKTMARTDISDFISTKANDYYIHVYQRLRDHFSDEQWKSLVELIETIPERDTMLHSDVHAKNVMVQDGELLLIDMDEIMLGHPIYDLADIYFMYAFVSKRPHGKYATGMELELCEDFNEKILVYCLKDLSEKEREKVIKALELIGRLRLNSGLILYLDQIDENEAKNRIPGIIEDVVDNLLPCQKELENGLALFPEWNDAS